MTLIRRVRAGDEAAFDELYARHRPAVSAVVRQLLGGAGHDEEAAVQDVFLRAHRALKRDQRPIRARPWLLSIARNRARDDLRRRPPARVPLDEALAAPQADPESELLRRETLRELVGEVAALPDQQRTALVLRAFEQRSHEQIAADMNTTVPAAKSLLLRARKNIARQLAAREADCRTICHELDAAHERRVRPPEHVRLHLRACASCRAHRQHLRRRRSWGAWLPFPAALSTGKLATAGCCAVVAAGAAATTVTIINPDHAPETIAGGQAMIGEPIRKGTALPTGFALVKQRVQLPSGLAHRGPMRTVSLTCPEGTRVSGLTLGGKAERDNLRAYQYASGVVLDRSTRAIIQYRAAPSLPSGSTALLGTVCRRAAP